MREEKFTTGPWELKPEECGVGYIRLRGSILGGRYKIANIITPVYEGVHERELTETRANANLIAAAPELLEALESAKWAIEEMLKLDTFNAIWDVAGKREATDIELKMQTALAKAYGE